ncbi:hypothetical protein BDD12DRAFT_865744 [Trichophaea hybrida]|nr:hypothetical protein BDD12DRAFT_865744 [Trichophaea hybrida]
MTSTLLLSATKLSPSFQQTPTIISIIMSNIPPKTPQKPQAGLAPANQRVPLALGQIAEGYYYSVQFVFPQFLNNPSPLQHVPTALAGGMPRYEVKQMQRRKQNGMLTDKNIDHARICLVVSIEDDHVILLLASTKPRTTYASTEHRWVPFEGSPNLPLQPRVVVKTAPAAAAFTNPSPAAPKPYLCFTHALKVQPITANMLLPNTPTLGNGAFKHTKSFLNGGNMLYCPNIDELKVVHEAYWQGVRYDNQGQQVKAAPSGGPSSTGGSGSDPSSNSKSLISGMTECAGLSCVEGSGPGGRLTREGDSESGSGSGNSSNVNRREASSGQNDIVHPSGGTSEELIEGAEAVTEHGKRKFSADHGPASKGIKLAQVIEHVEFFPPLKRKAYGGWVKDEDVFISHQDRQRMLQAMTGDPDAQLGTLREGYWEPIEDSESEDEDEEIKGEAVDEVAISRGDRMIKGGGTTLLGTFGVDMAGEPVPTHAMFFPFAGEGTAVV